MSSGFEFIHDTNKSERAILLFHGLTGSPFEMKKFGKYLFDNGFDVYGICLPGHGDMQSEIYTVKYIEWIECAGSTFEKLAQKYEEVFIGGLCLGAVISLYLAEKYRGKIKGIISLSTTLYLDGWRLPWYSIFMPIALHTIFRYYYTYPECEPYGVKNKKTRATIKRILSKPDVGMDNYPMSAFHELLELSSTTRKSLSEIISPILIIHSKEDDLTSIKGAKEVFAKISTTDKELIILDNSYHMVLYDNEKDFVFKKSLDFLNTHSLFFGAKAI